MENRKDGNLDARFQSADQQSVDQVAGTEADTGHQSFNVTENKRSGGKLKQEVAAEVVAQGKGVGFDQLANPGAYGKVSGSYTGDGANNVLGSLSNTPVLSGPAQGRTREGKKLSDPNKDINNMASEQYATFFEQPKALAFDREATVGYNGNPSNISARAQKNSGSTPAEMLYDRSLDEIRRDHVIFTCGQNVNVTGDEYPKYTGMKEIYDEEKDLHEYKFYPRGVEFGEDKEPLRGNFMPNAIKVVFDKKDGSVFVKSFSIDETDLSVNGVDDYTVNDSSPYNVINVNRAELVRQEIDNDHGSPTSPKYNPLGRSVLEPSATMLYLMDIEATDGAIITSALRHASKSKSYYLSRVAKDGITQLEPAIDAFYGHLLTAHNSSDTITNFAKFRGEQRDCPYFSTEWNKLGSAAILLKVFDSLGKYKTKADIVNQPRGIKLPLSTGLNNFKPFHVSDEFIKALNAIDVFSTIDRGYDPSAPTMVSDGLAYVTPYSWSRALSYERKKPGDPRDFKSEILTYSYQAGNGNQRYYVKVAEPLLNGIAWFIEQYADQIYSAVGGSNGEAVLNIPVRSYSTKFSLFDYLVAASLAYVLYERTNTMKDILDEERNGKYPFGHLHGITEDDILNPTNYGKMDQFSRLIVKEMKPSTAMRWIMPEVFFPMGKGERNMMYPWYLCESDFNQVSGDEDGAKLVMVNEPSHYPAPVIRSGVAISYLDNFYGMSLKDQLLCLDRASTIPGFKNKKDGRIKGVFYKYGQDSEGILVRREASLSIKDYLSTPRQMGWIIDAPYPVCHVISEAYDSDAGDTINDGELIGYFSAKRIDKLSAFNNSFVARAYQGAYGSAPTGILDNAVVTINRGQAFAQKWSDYCASSDEISDFPFPLSVSAAFSATSGDDTNDIKMRENFGLFKPFTDKEGNLATDNMGYLAAFMKVFWARIQKLPFILNPFEAGSSYVTKGAVDPFDFAYMFGLSGFMPVTYFEELSNRMSAKYSKMFNFTEDPYFADSPLFNNK